MGGGSGGLRSRAGVRGGGLGRRVREAFAEARRSAVERGAVRLPHGLLRRLRPCGLLPLHARRQSVCRTRDGDAQCSLAGASEGLSRVPWRKSQAKSEVELVVTPRVG